MPIIIAILAFLGIFGASLMGVGPTGQKLVQPIGPPGYGGPVCLDQSSITDEAILFQFPKATNENTPFPNSDRCSGGGCQGEDFEDYVKILGAEAVIVQEIMPNEPTTRLYKQSLPPDARFDPYRDMIYRASCNDWCLLSLPYGGSFHCDFIFLLKDRAHLVTRTIDGQDQLYPKDCENPDDPATCSVFEVLFRKGGEVPENVKCNGQPGHSSKNFLSQVFAQTETFIYLGGESYILAQEEPITLVKIDMRSQAEGRTKVSDSVIFRGVEYEAYKNLTNKIEMTDDFLYLVEPGKVDETDQSDDEFFKLQYLEFRKTPPKRPGAKTLQLGTFPIPVGKGWWRKWIDESKPAIYLYPEEPTRLRVKLNPAGKLTVSDPPYDPEKGWEIIAYPDGTLITLGDTLHATRYTHLFYEANLEKVFVSPEGFVVAGQNLVNFFKVTLPKLGLNTKETQDFIDYWMTRLDEQTPYYFIHFLDEEQIEKLEPLEISPISPISQIRIRAYFKPLTQPIEVSPQILPSPPERAGFTLVEWGGLLDK